MTVLLQDSSKVVNYFLKIVFNAVDFSGPVSDDFYLIFTFGLMTTGAFSQNVGGKLCSELKSVTDNI